MERRPLDGAELGELESRVQDLVGEFTRRSLGLDPGGAPADIGETDGGEQLREPWLARAAVCHHLERFTASAVLDALFEVTVHRGADFHDVEGVLGPDRGWSDQLHKHLGVKVPRGEHTVVVIERGTATQDEASSPESVYDADRGPWQLQAEARAEAQYAVVTENGVVRRVYLLHDWTQTGPDRWSFAGRELTAREVRAGYNRGSLPIYVPPLSLEFRLDRAAGAAAGPGARSHRFRCHCK